MAVNNVIHNLSADATDLDYADSNLTLFKHDLFESNNEWSIVRKDETSLTSLVIPGLKSTETSGASHMGKIISGATEAVDLKPGIILHKNIISIFHLYKLCVSHE